MIFYKKETEKIELVARPDSLLWSQPGTPRQPPALGAQAGHPSLADHDYQTTFDNLPTPVYHPIVIPPPGFCTTQAQGRCVVLCSPLTKINLL